MSKRKATHYFIIAVVFAAFFYVLSFGSSATSYGYTTPNFDVNIKTNIDATFDFTEKITVDFGNYAQHGIYRNIPLDTSYRIRNIQVADKDYEIYDEDGNKVIKIGSEDYTLTGKHTYVIHYTIQCLEDRDQKADYLSLDVLPTGWKSSIDHAKVTISLPKGVKFTQLSHYTGAYHSKEDNVGSWTYENNKITFEGTNLKQGVGATLEGVLPEGTWQGAYSYDWLRNLVLASVLGALVLLILLRITWGKNPSYVETVEFYPPEGLTPVEVGYIMDGNVDDSDITTTFFYLADKGYIDINEYRKNSFEFTRLNNLLPSEKPFVQRFYRGLFGKTAFDDYDQVAADSPKKLKARTNKIGKRMSTAYADIPSMVEDEFSGSHQLITDRSRRADRIGKLLYMLVTGGAAGVLILINTYCPVWFAAVVAVAIGTIFMMLTCAMTRIYYYRKSRKPIKTAFRSGVTTGLYFAALLVYMYAVCSQQGYNDNRITTVMLAFFLVSPLLLMGMKSYSPWSAALYGRVVGFRNFIRDAELERIEALVEENPSYFYNVLPYAYVFGMTKKWASKFEGIAVDSPDWYSPYTMGNQAFDVVMMDSMLNHVSNSVEDTIASAIASSGDQGGGGSVFSGGSSGGGFSGGGAGGGGGGSW